MIEYGVFFSNGKAYDVRLTNEDGHTLFLKDLELEDLVDDLVEDGLCVDKNAYDDMNYCGDCDRVDPQEMIEEEAVIQWVKDNIAPMTEVVLEAVSDKLEVVVKAVKQALITYAKDNVCFLQREDLGED